MVLQAIGSVLLAHENFASNSTPLMEKLKAPRFTGNQPAVPVLVAPRKNVSRLQKQPYKNFNSVRSPFLPLIHYAPATTPIRSCAGARSPSPATTSNDCCTSPRATPRRRAAILRNPDLLLDLASPCEQTASPPAATTTVLELTGADGTGLIFEVFAMLADIFSGGVSPWRRRRCTCEKDRGKERYKGGEVGRRRGREERQGGPVSRVGWGGARCTAAALRAARERAGRNKRRKRWRDPAGLDWSPGGATAAVGRRPKGQVPREGRGSSCWAGGRGSMMFSSVVFRSSIRIIKPLFFI
ncbi:uncharacterized protein [Triticum aestivum]|uniref:uncharacterized protein n=1 Tax=Triticum aestivum TaxID=4565 RepID=UPI001D030BF0|nr:uncharacterized protein LOC123060455 [Triticum aestivum]